MLNQPVQTIAGPGTTHFDEPQEENLFNLAERPTADRRDFYTILYASLVSDHATQRRG
jgi:hypothetical protein